MKNAHDRWKHLTHKHGAGWVNVSSAYLAWIVLYQNHPTKVNNMLRYAIIFLVIAIIAAVFGFGGIAGDAAWIAQVLLVVFVILAIVSFVLGRRGPAAGV